MSGEIGVIPEGYKTQAARPRDSDTASLRTASTLWYSSAGASPTDAALDRQRRLLGLFVSIATLGGSAPA
jgi:hypothetical protein